MKFFNFLVSCIIFTAFESIAFAFEINSLEKAYQIPSLTSAIERIEVKRNQCGARGKNLDRWIDLRFKENETVFSGYLSTSFVEEIGQQQQCQQNQNQFQQITTNKLKSKLYYVDNKSKLESEFRIIADSDITNEVLSVIKEGPLLVIDGGNSWKRFGSLPYKSEARIEDANSNYIEINFATNGSEICVKRLLKYLIGGTYETFCVIPLN